MVVSVPTHVIQRDERFYERAQEFVPERWMEGNEHMIKDRRAYLPFSTGTWGCAGKNLALMELRMALGRVAINFDIAFAEGETGRAVDEETKDTFTLKIPSMMVRLTPRK